MPWPGSVETTVKEHRDATSPLQTVVGLPLNRPVVPIATGRGPVRRVAPDLTLQTCDCRLARGRRPGWYLDVVGEMRLRVNEPSLLFVDHFVDHPALVIGDAGRIGDAPCVEYPLGQWIAHFSSAQTAPLRTPCIVPCLQCRWQDESHQEVRLVRVGRALRCVLLHLAPQLRTSFACRGNNRPVESVFR